MKPNKDKLDLFAGKNNQRLVIEVRHNIRAWRQNRKLSMKELARDADLSASAISQLERGRARYTQESLEKIAHAMKLEPWQLLAIKPNVGFEDKLRREAIQALQAVCQSLTHHVIGDAVSDYMKLRKEAASPVFQG